MRAGRCSCVLQFFVHTFNRVESDPRLFVEGALEYGQGSRGGMSDEGHGVLGTGEKRFYQCRLLVVPHHTLDFPREFLPILYPRGCDDALRRAFPARLYEERERCRKLGVFCRLPAIEQALRRDRNARG